MRSILQIQQKIIPDILDTIEKRFEIMKRIQQLQPVGRRVLAMNLQMSERTLRSEVDFLKDQNLLTFRSSGMTLNNEGENVLAKLKEMMHQLHGLKDLETQLKKKYQLKDVVIISGNCEESPYVKNELGCAAAQILQKHLKDNAIVAVTGGTTMESMAANMPYSSMLKQLVFVPTRGGMGGATKSQASAICEQLALKTNGNHQQLYIPEQLGEQSFQILQHEPVIKDVINLLKSATIVVHGIGDAELMARKRNTPQSEIDKMMAAKAVGEVFGQYYDELGNIVKTISAIGIKLSDLTAKQTIISVAGGATKAKAVKSFIKIAPEKPILVTDESIASLLLKDE